MPDRKHLPVAVTGDMGMVLVQQQSSIWEGPASTCYRPVVRDLSRMLQQLHAFALVVPQQRCVMQKPLLGDGLCVATKLDIPKTVVCTHPLYLAFLDVDLDKPVRIALDLTICVSGS